MNEEMIQVLEYEAQVRLRLIQTLRGEYARRIQVEAELADVKRDNSTDNEG